jgi:hypothetical protein
MRTREREGSGSETFPSSARVAKQLHRVRADPSMNGVESFRRRIDSHRPASFVGDNQHRRKNPFAKNDLARIQNDLARIDRGPYNA